MATVTVLTHNPLIRAGYEGAVSTTSLEIHHGRGGADLALRSEDVPPSDASIDVLVGQGSVVVTLRALPDEVTWVAALRLLQALLK